MITIADIKRAYNGLVKKAFPEYAIYGTDVAEGYKRPALFVTITQDEGGRETRNTRRTECTIETTVFLGEKGEEEALEAISKLEEITKDYIDVGGHILPVTDFSHKFIGQRGDVPVTRTVIEFLQNAKDPDNDPLMQKLRLKEGLKDGNAID